MKNSTPCKLCGLPVRLAKNETVDASKDYFCCNGCKMVYAMIMESDLYSDETDFKTTDLYQRCLAAGVIPASEEDIPKPLKAKSGETAIPENLLSYSFSISDMWCPACAWIVEENLSKKKGVFKAGCNFSSDRGKVVYDPVQITPDDILKTVQDLGYGASPLQQSKKKNQTEFIRLCIAAFLTMNVMMFSWAIYSGFFIELSGQSVQMLAWPAWIMATIVLIYGGLPIHKRALAGITAGKPGMETLISTASLTAYGYSLFNLFAGSLHLYFDTSAMLIVLVLIGKTLERSAKEKISESLSDFFSLVPEKVNLVTDRFPKGRYVSVKQLAKGDIFQAREGEILAADGRIVKGAAVMDQSSITGEAKPVNVARHDSVKSGSKVLKGWIQVTATDVGEASILGKMLSIMESSLSSKTVQTARLEGLLKFFVPLVMGLAILTTLVSILYGLTSYESISRGISVMVISCPCALGLAIPLALVAGVSKAGKMGILVRDSEAFERTAGLDTIVFDKTGTITSGRMSLLDITTAAGFTKEKALALACTLEADSHHYIAHTLKAHGEKTGITALNIENIRHHASGITGELAGQELRLGSRSYAEITAPPAPENFQPEPMDAAVITTIYLSVDNTLAATFRFGDCLRHGIKPLIAALQKKGCSIFLLSGDSGRSSWTVASLTGISPLKTHGEMLPHEKAAFIDDLKKEGRTVAMVGDGVNDAPAMAGSDLAVAIRSGLEPGETVAAITLMQEDPGQLLDFIHLAARVNRTVKQNLGFALIYNVISIPVAASGLLNPMVAATAMLLSSLSVTINTLLLVKTETGSKP